MEQLGYVCFLCGGDARYRCSGCVTTTYCDEFCQKDSHEYLQHDLLCVVLGDGSSEDDFEIDFTTVCMIIDQIEEEITSVPFRRPEIAKKRSSRPRRVTLSPSKARKILRDGSVKGHPLTEKQKRFFGWVAGGGRRK